jgi:hypothetical protein
VFSKGGTMSCITKYFDKELMTDEEIKNTGAVCARYGGEAVSF